MTGQQWLPRELSPLLPVCPCRSVQQPKAHDSARSKLRSVSLMLFKKKPSPVVYLWVFLPCHLAFPCEGDIPLTVLVSRQLAQHDPSSDKIPRQLHGRMTLSASHHQLLPCHQLPHQSFNEECRLSLLWAPQCPQRHFAGLEGHCALLKLGQTIFPVTFCPDGGLGLSGNTCPRSLRGWSCQKQAYADGN